MVMAVIPWIVKGRAVINAAADAATATLTFTARDETDYCQTEHEGL
jgi:hypothetical protein